jgi:translation initiation factor 1
MARDNDPLVYSTDGAHVDPARTVLRLFLEKAGRRGKGVTVVGGLPPHPTRWADLLKQLKAHCGAGGTLREERLEIQGDQRDKVQAFLEQLGFTVRRAGG